MMLEHTITPYTKINSKWLKDLNIRHDTIKLLEESIGKTFYDINCTNVFLGQCPNAIDINTKRTIQVVLKNLKSDLSMRHTSEHKPILL